MCRRSQQRQSEFLYREVATDSHRRLRLYPPQPPDISCLRQNFVTLREHFGRDDTLTLSGNGQTVHIAARRIHPKRSDFSGTAPNSDGAPLYRGKPFYGTDGSIPKSVFAIEQITLNGQAVPAAELQGLFLPDFAATARGSYAYDGWEAYYRRTDKTLYLFNSVNNDAGSFGMCFVFKDGKFQRRYVWTALL